MKWSHYWANNANTALIISHLLIVANAAKPSLMFVCLGVFWVVMAMVAHWAHFACRKIEQPKTCHLCKGEGRFEYTQDKTCVCPMCTGSGVLG